MFSTRIIHLEITNIEQQQLERSHGDKLILECSSIHSHTILSGVTGGDIGDIRGVLYAITIDYLQFQCSLINTTYLKI